MPGCELTSLPDETPFADADVGSNSEFEDSPSQAVESISESLNSAEPPTKRFAAYQYERCHLRNSKYSLLWNIIVSFRSSSFHVRMQLL